MLNWKTVTVHLRGLLAKVFGPVHRLQARHTSDILAYFAVNYDGSVEVGDSKPNWIEWIRARQHWGFRIVTPSGDIDFDEFEDSIPDEIVIRICHTGSGGILNSPFFKIVLGLGLLIAGIATGNIGLAFMGAGLLLKGIAGLLRKSDKKGKANTITGSANTVDDDSIVPIGFGRYFGKPLLISGEIRDAVQVG
jgi:predicted phage tail protein